MSRAPYKPGDAINVLTYHPEYGTVLATRPVEAIRECDDNIHWVITWTTPTGLVEDTTVDATGHDIHRYIEPA